MLMFKFIIISLLLQLSVAEAFQCLYYKAKIRLNKATTTHVDEIMHMCRIEGINYAFPDILFSRLEELNLQSGITTLQVQGLNPNVSNSMLDLTSNHEHPTINIHSHNRNLVSSQRTTGNQSLLVIRVISSKDSEMLEPSLSIDQLRNQMFGDPSNPSRISLKSQYAMCSDDNLNFIPASFDGNDSGVVNLIVNQNMKNTDFSLQMENIVFKAFEDKFNARAQYDYAMFCLPQGMSKEFLAYGIVNDKYSFFSDPWCGSLSGTMHEIGHNMGMDHSGQIGKDSYDDESCIMGIGYEQATSPQKCFNGQKLWAFNWFPNNKKIVDPIANGEWRGKLIAFVDVGLSQAPVVLRVGDLYLVYNRAKKYNYQVNEMADMVTVVEAPTSTSESSLRAGIDGSPGRNSFSILSKFPGGTYRITIDVCKLGKEGAIDYADLSIRREGTRSSCATAISPPNPSKSPYVTCEADTDCPGIKERCLLTSEGKICLKIKNPIVPRPYPTKAPFVTCDGDTDCPGIKERCLLTSEGKICLKLKNPSTSRPYPTKSSFVTCEADTDCLETSERCLLTSEGKICLKFKNANLSVHPPSRPKTVKTPTARNAANLPRKRKFSMAPTSSNITKAPINSIVTKSPMRRKLTSHQ